MSSPKNTKTGNKKDYQQFINKEELIGEGLSFSDIFDDSIPNEEKPPQLLVPMEEMDYPIQAKDLFAGLFQENPKSQLKMAPLVKETDDVEYNGKEYSWDDEGVSVFVLYEKKKNVVWVASVFNVQGQGGFYSNWHGLEHLLNSSKHINVLDMTTHGDLDLVIFDNSLKDIGENILQGRLFELDEEEPERYIMGFWEPQNIVKPFQKYIEEYLNRIKIDPKKILWTHSDGAEVITYDEMFGVKKRKSRSKQQLELLKKIHLNAVLKKKVLQLPPHPFQLLADKLGVTVAQLRQIAGMAVAEEIKPRTLEERIKIYEEMGDGDGYWLDPKGVFHDVDKPPFKGHVSWAKHHLKDKEASYPHLLTKGYIWVGVSDGSINFDYMVPPSAVQLYMLKKEAVDSGYKLYDLEKKEFVDTTILKETEEIRYQKKIYDFDTHGYSVMVLVQKAKDIYIEERTSEKLPDDPFYLATINGVRFVSDWKELADDVNKHDSALYDQTHSGTLSSLDDALNRMGVKDELNSLLQARIFLSGNFPGGYAIGFWESRKVVKKYKDKVIDYLNRVGIKNYKDILWTASGGGTIQTYDQFWKEETAEADPRKIALMKLAHLDAVAKKKLIGQPTNKLQDLADSLGITVVQLRQQLGSLDESDKVLYKGQKFHFWEDGVSILLVFPQNLWVASTFREPFALGYTSNDISLEKKLTKRHKDKKYIEYPYNHPDFKVELEMAVGHIPIPVLNGRLFRNHKMSYHQPGAFLIGFWEEKSKVIENKKAIFEYLKKLSLKPEEVLWSSDAGQKDAVSYYKFFGEPAEKSSLSPEERELMKMQHLDALAKRKLLKLPPSKLENLADKMGITVSQLRQQLGSMDESEYARDPHRLSGSTHDWHSPNVLGIFTIYSPGFYTAAKSHSGEYITGTSEFFCSDKWIEEALNQGFSTFHGRKYVNMATLTHTTLAAFTQEAQHDILHKEKMPTGEKWLNTHGRVAARAWKFSDKFVVGFWQDIGRVRSEWNNVKKCMEFLGMNPEKTFFTFEGHFKVQISYSEFMSGIDVPEIDPRQLELLKLQHLDVQAKKELLKKYPTHRLQKLADEMGIPLAKLRQVLGSLDEVEGAYDSQEEVTKWWDSDGIFTIWNNFWVIQQPVGNYSENKVKYTSDDKKLQTKLNSNEEYTDGEDDDYIKTHGRMSDAVENAYKELGKNIQLDYHGDIAAGRVFIMGDKQVVGFWQSMDEVRPHWNKIEKIIKMMGVKPRWARYTFDNYYEVEYEFGYSDIIGKTPPRKVDPQEKMLMKLQHLNPDAKKALLQLPPNRFQLAADKLGITVVELRRLLGRDIAEGKINEDPDSLYIQTNNLYEPIGIDFSEHEFVTAVVCIGRIRFRGKQDIGWLGGAPWNGEIYYDRKSTGVNFEGDTHSEILDAMDDLTDFEYSRRVHYRLYNYEGKFYAAFWELQKTCKMYLKQIKDSLDFFTGGKFNRIYCQFAEQDDTEYISFNKAFSEKVKRTKTKKQVRLAQQLHLLPPEKKADLLKKMGAANINKQQAAADKLGITVAELRQLLGLAVAENINETADYINVNGKPYDYASNEVESVLCVGWVNGERSWIRWDNHTGNIYLNGDIISYEPYQKNLNLTHGSVIYGAAMFEGQLDENDEINGDFYSRGVQGRIYKVKNRYYIGFWEEQTKVLNWKNEILEAIENFKPGLSKEASYQFGRMYYDEFVDYNTAFEENTQLKTPLSPEEAKRLEQLHLLAPQQKAKLLKAIGATSVDKQQAAADKLGMTVAQLRQALGRTDESVNPSLNATLIWLKKDGTVYDTDDTQHGLYVADNPGLFGVSNALVQKVFKNANTDENFDFDDAAAIMCEKAFQHRWMRVVKIPWRNKIMVEGQEPTKEQRRVLEDWFFEDRNTDIIWQQWVSSKFGPPHPVTLFTSKNVLEANK